MLYSQLLRARKNVSNTNNLQGELTKQWFAIFLGYFALFASLVLAIFDFLSQRYLSFFIDIFTTFCYLITIILFNKGQVTFPKYLLFFSGYFAIIANASILGRDCGLNNLWFPYICGIFILFDSSKIKSILLFLFLIVLAILFLEFTNYQFLAKYAYLNTNFKLYTILCYTISITILTVYIFTLHRSNEKYKNKINLINKNLTRSNQNLSKANIELDSFVYKASHDLRAPLASLLGLIEIAKSEKDFDQIAIYLNLCKISVNKLDLFIVDILNISKNERQNVQVELINFRTIINDVFAQLKHFDNTKSMKINIKIDETSNFYSDSRRLNIIFNNLIANAIIYSDSTKPLSVLNINVEINPDCAFISMIDNGLGIKSEIIEKVFEMFYRGTYKGNGSGLGLYIVKETIEKLKGKVEISSEESKWTHLKFMLPNLKLLKKL